MPFDLATAKPTFDLATAKPAFDLSTAQPAKPHEAVGVLESLQAGYQGSATGLAIRGKLPDIVLDPSHATWYEKALGMVGQVVSEIPEMVAGSFLGGSAGTFLGGAAGSAVPVVGTTAGAIGGGVFGAGAGTFAVPAAIRESYIQALSKGDVTSSADFLDRATIVLKQTAKEAGIGALTMGAGGVAARTVGKALAPAVGEAVSVPTARAVIGGVKTGAEVGTMIVSPAALEGRMPEAQDFANAAIVIAGMKGAGAVAGKLRAIYAKTGIEPEQVVSDATTKPEIKAQLEAPMIEIPEEYRPRANAETGRKIVPGVKAEQVAEQPFADIPQVPGEPSKPTHVNYNYIETPEDVKLALSRISEVYEAEIQQQRRGTVSWEETSREAGQMLADTIGGDPKLLAPREPGTAAGAAEILARKQMVVGAAEEMMRARDALLGKGESATDADRLSFLQAVERTAMIQQEFLGARAEAGRALNILKSSSIEAERAKQVQEVINMFGGKDPLRLAEALDKIDTVEGAAKFARDAVKPTKWEMFIEGFKAFILSGPITHMANLIGNSTMLAMRPPIDAVASALGAMRGTSDRVTAMEPIARIAGNGMAAIDVLRQGAILLREGRFGELAGKVFSNEAPAKGEQIRAAIPGKVGEILRRGTFGLLSSTDSLFRSLNERGEAYALAIRDATAAGLDPRTREFREAVVRSVEQPTEARQKEIADAGVRFTFNTQLGEKGQALQSFVRAWRLEWLVPFIRTPGNILKELVRMTPASPLVGEWRHALKEGGAERDKALAELAVGAAAMSAIMSYTFSGSITGQGDPDPNKRRVKSAAGWQPYSVKVGDTYYNYQRIQPIGTLMGIAADIAETWDHLTDEESDKVPKMLAVAFANAVTNQTFLQGITNLVNATSDPKRFGPRFVQGYAGSVVPSIVAQPTQMSDPVQREVNSMLDAIKARIPGARETLLPKRDIFGEPVETKTRLGGISPVTETTRSTDKVRLEADRIGFATADAPKKIHLGRATGKIGDVKLTPEQQDIFTTVSGKMAHDILSNVVESPAWDEAPRIAQRRAYQRAFLRAHKAGAVAAFPPGPERDAAIQQIAEKIATELQ